MGQEKCNFTATDSPQSSEVPQEERKASIYYLQFVERRERVANQSLRQELQFGS